MNFHPQTLHFRVAEAPFCVTFRDESASRDLIPSYAPFYLRTPPEGEEQMFRCEVGAGLVPSEAAADGATESVGDFDCGNAQHVLFRRPEGGYHIHIATPEGKEACAMRTNADFTQIGVSVFGTESDKAFGLNNALMIAFAFAGAYHHILMIHSSVTQVGDSAYCFLGKSGTGKSTHSRLWLQYVEGSELLNDDNPAVRYLPERDEVRVYGTPWSGKTPCYRNRSARLAAFVRLEQAPVNTIRQHRPIEAFANVLSSASTMIWDKPSYNGITHTLEAVARHCASFHLKCRPDEEACRVCREEVMSSEFSRWRASGEPAERLGYKVTAGASGGTHGQITS